MSVHHDPLLGVSDVNALTGLAFRLRQHVAEPVSLVAGLRTVAERMAKSRPHDAARLGRVVDAYERAAVTPHLEAASALDALVLALRSPEEVPT